jgi:hypothetical protein
MTALEDELRPEYDLTQLIPVPPERVATMRHRREQIKKAMEENPNAHSIRWCPVTKRVYVEPTTKRIMPPIENEE